MASNTLPDVRTDDIRTPSPILSPTSTLVDGSPREARTPIRHRPTFARLASVFDGTQQKYDVVKGDDETPASEREAGSGLGISYGPSTIHARSFPASTGAGNVDTSYDPGPVNGTTYDTGSPYWSSTSRGKQSTTSFASTIQHGFSPQSDTRLLRGKPSFTETLKSHYNDFTPSSACPSHRQFHHSCSSWPSLIIFTLSIYSTIFSGIYLVLAAHGPRYGKLISNREDGLLTANSASLLTAFFAKTIEISFATVFVAFLGQVLWRRAFLKSKGRGVTLAQMDMRSWVMQPGTMLTRFGAMRSTIMSSLGILTFAAATMALLYTTASEALVQPQLRTGQWEPKSMQGVVKSSWANSNYLSQICSSPMKASDTAYGGTTCLQIEYAAQAYHNYQSYLSDWDTPVKYGNGSTDLGSRPQGFALVTENTTVSAPWIEMNNGGSLVNGRVINNVSMAMPHLGVTSAARDSRNGIMQPEDLDGLGVYSLHASVPSPAVNVLCANINATEIQSIVYAEFTPGPFNASNWPIDSASVGKDFMNNKTVVDDLFGWGEQYSQAPPLFPKLPLEYNTVVNTTGPYGRTAIYLLGKPPAATTTDYFLCSIKAYLTPECSTRYNVSRSGATLEALCEDETDNMRYIKSLSNATRNSISGDWVEGATDWVNSLSLSSGVTDADAANARLLTQLALAAPTDSTTTELLSAENPSPAEALAVMAGCTLLMGMQDAPFVEFWNYTSHILEGEQYQWFNAMTQTREYASGGSKGYQHGFFSVLAMVFVLNTVCLVYLSIHRGLVTDFSEPVNLFSLAVNSPPSDVMAGSCGGGPQGRQYRVPWYVNAAGDHLYIENGVSGGEEEHEMHSRGEYENRPSSIRRAFERLSKQANFI